LSNGEKSVTIVKTNILERLMINSLVDFLQNSPTAYHACDNVKELLLARGFTQLRETDDWEIQAGGKYFVTRGGSAVIAFTVGELDEFSFKIAAHSRSFGASASDKIISL